MKSCLKFLFLILFLSSCKKETTDKVLDFQTPFELSKGTETATYTEVIEFYMNLAKEFPEINVQTVGTTDSGLPLHIVTYNPDADFNFIKVSKTKTVILINNGIHPGESDGIDATMLLYRDLVTRKITPPKNTILVTIPIYNIGGALNRNSTSRVNQNGPKSYGFRGNAQNYDLNRDFIKADTKNSRTFNFIFHSVKPDIFIDNHVSNGADYQYTLTHLFTQHNKLGGELGTYLQEEMMPALEKNLAVAKWDITPYVNVHHSAPDNGFSQFMDSPRYSTGYTALWNTLGIMVETHMLKPYEQRVKGTYQLMISILDIAETDNKKIKALRANAHQALVKKMSYPIQWAVDTTKTSILDFKGFEANIIPSEITGFSRLKYDQNRPYTKKVVYSNHFRPSQTVTIPAAYIVKKGWSRVMELMESNEIVYNTLRQDTILTVESYKIDSFQTVVNAYEGHYPHFNTKVNKSLKEIKFSQGDYIISTDQEGIRYVLETLEPEAVDSFFNWNFFDAILQQKEGYSEYVFEEVALDMLNANDSLKKSFLLKKAADKEFSSNGRAQLDWIYKQSQFYESAHLQYPVYRVLRDSTLQIEGLIAN
jgi:hypothetical protein